MRPFAFMDRRVRGFRVVEVGGLAVLLVLILAVYLAKTGAGAKRADIDHVQTQIDDEQSQIRILRAEVATLEQPERLEALSAKYLGLAPVSERREITAAALADVAQATGVDQHGAPVTSDPLTQAGSPDLLPGEAPTTSASASAGPKPAAASAPAPVTVAQAQAAPSPNASGPMLDDAGAALARDGR